ncbi:MAG: hypothetical protein WBD08_12110, partial [Candidatus Acidiferrales bacterium]
FCEGYARMSGAIGATREALIAAFCRLDKSLSCCWQKGWLVGAVGIENNTGWDFRDLAGMRENSKSLKRNAGEPEGILIGPSKAPRFFFLILRRIHCFFFLTVRKRKSASGPNLATRMASRQMKLWKDSIDAAS